MNDKNKLQLKLNAGTGMVMGIFVGAAIALIVELVTGDGSFWAWTIAVGLACGLAIGTNAASKSNSKNEDVS